MVFFRYIIRSFFSYFFLSLIFCVFLFVLFDFIDKSRYYYPTVDSDSTYILLFYLCQIPYLIVQCAPLASLFASAIVLNNLSRSNEMTAMLSFSYKPSRLLYPLSLCGGLLVLGLFLVSEFIIPVSSKKAHYITKVVFEGRKHSFINKSNWSRDGKVFYSYSFYNPDKVSFKALKIIKVDENFRLKEVQKIEEAFYLEKEKLWEFKGVRVFSFLEGHKDFSVVEKEEEKKRGILPISPDLLRVERRLLQELTLSELSSIIDRNKNNGMNLLEIFIAWHTKIAYLWVSFLFVFGGFPLAFIFGRKKETVLVFLSILVLGFSYWLLFSLSRAVLLSGVVNVVLGAWISNILLLFYLVFQIQRVLRAKV